MSETSSQTAVPQQQHQGLFDKVRDALKPKGERNASKDRNVSKDRAPAHSTEEGKCCSCPVAVLSLRGVLCTSPPFHSLCPKDRRLTSQIDRRGRGFMSTGRGGAGKLFRCRRVPLEPGP
jgi:hypothetical protein